MHWIDLSEKDHSKHLQGDSAQARDRSGLKLQDSFSPVVPGLAFQHFAVVIEHCHGRIVDPACASDGMFVTSCLSFQSYAR